MKMWYVMGIWSGIPEVSLYSSEALCRKAWDECFDADEIADKEYTDHEGNPLTADNAWGHGWCEMHKQEWRWGCESVDYFYVPKTIDPFTMTAQVLFEELIERLDMMAESFADNRSDLSDWCGFTLVGKGVDEESAKRLMLNSEDEDESKRRFTFDSFYGFENRPSNTIHFAEYIMCQLTLLQEKGINNLNAWDRECLLHYLGMSSMGLEQDIEDLDEDDLDLAIRSTVMLKKMWDLNDWHDETPLELGTWQNLSPADGRTHILGGVVDHGTHTTGVCSDDCWCKEELK